MDRENGIKLDGYLVLRFTAFVVRYRPGYIAAQIRDAFRAAGHALITLPGGVLGPLRPAGPAPGRPCSAGAARGPFIR